MPINKRAHNIVVVPRIRPLAEDMPAVWTEGSKPIDCDECGTKCFISAETQEFKVHHGITNVMCMRCALGHAEAADETTVQWAIGDGVEVMDDDPSKLN